MNLNLFLKKYRLAEKLAIGDLSADHIRAAFPLTFFLHGYPTKIGVNADILKYVDTMQELADLNYFFNKLYLSESEKARVQEICEVVPAITQKYLRKRVEPLIGPLATLPVARTADIFAKIQNKKKLNIMEIGSGSGYLTAHLGKMGHRIFATDTTEGFYLWQNLFWQTLFGANYIDLVHLKTFSSFHKYNQQIIHLPWWVFYSCYKDTLPRIDLIICDHAFGEMYPYGYKYVVSLIKLLARGNPNLFVIYESFGETQFQGPEQLNCDLALFDFQSKKISPFTCLLSANNKFKDAINSNEFALCKAAGPRENYVNAGRNCLALNREFSPKSIEFYEFLGYKSPFTI